MVFSFFKKDPKERSDVGKSAPRQSARPAGRPQPAAVNRTPPVTSQKPAPSPAVAPDKELARSLAMETAAKIDAIESEMARDFLRPVVSGAAEFSNSAANSTLGKPSQQPVPPPPAPEQSPATKTMPSLEDLLTGIDDWQVRSNAIELQGEGGGSAIEETAILFANGLVEPAEAGLRAAIETDSLGDAAQRGWLMLFELLQQRNDKAAFESLTIEYVLRFESSPPAWIEYKEEPPVRPATGPARPAGAALIVLPESIDAGVVKHLEQLKQQSQMHQAITVDASNVRAVDMVGAELLLRVIHAFKRATHELTLVGADLLVAPLRSAVEAGRRDPSDAVWMLLLEVFRLLGRQHDFEETGIQYCITYEVSPPSWEPAPPNLKTREAQPQAPRTAEPAGEGLQWRGTLRGEGEPHFGRLVTQAKTDRQVVIDCTYLKRIEFATATAMLSMLTKVRQTGASVEFRNVNYLIGALFSLLGIDAVAQIQLRRA